ncbi:hypothetical protein [Sphaerobacter sp.]|uniref:hypothetical protein n=1 Tax=Sphaerobacter sp. TaxID=2099654 RepID=UPI001E076822|nr:hypothetical protein [Sphaerobacter sp.]MBX5446819.1 hypothetical protein [Sphaerobacter sp.]
MVGDEHSSPRRSTRGTTLLGAAVVLVPVGVLTILAIYAPDVVLALASPIILGGLGVWQLQAQLKANREMQAAQALRERKSRVYSQFVDLLIKQMLAEKQTEKKQARNGKHNGQKLALERATPSSATKRDPDPALIRHLTHLMGEMVVWGSDGVLKKWGEFKKLGAGVAMNDAARREQGLRLARKLAEILLEIRRDLGHMNEGFCADDVLRLFINDWDEVLQTVTDDAGQRSNGPVTTPQRDHR